MQAEKASPFIKISIFFHFHKIKISVPGIKSSAVRLYRSDAAFIAQKNNATTDIDRSGIVSVPDLPKTVNMI